MIYEPSFRQTIVWTRLFRSPVRIESEWCNSYTEARNQAIETARAMGWTPPKCWQLWRRNDTNP